MMKRSWFSFACVSALTVLAACECTKPEEKAAPDAADKAAPLILDAARRKPVTVAGPPNSMYSADGAKSLVDGQMGSWDYQDAAWMGWWYEDKPFAATIDLGEPVSIRELGVHTLTSSEVWIFYPRKVEFEVSKDGKVYQKVATLEPTKADLEKVESEVKVLKASGLNTTARYVRVRAERYGELPNWHQGHGGADGYEGQAWLFIDEILVNPK